MAMPISRVGPADNRQIPRSQMTPGSRAFVSACVLGPMGRRGIWVERRRGTINRCVVGFNAASTQLQSTDLEGKPTTFTGESDSPSDLDEEGFDDSETEQDDHQQRWWEVGTRAKIDGRTVFEVISYDLRGTS